MFSLTLIVQAGKARQKWIKHDFHFIFSSFDFMIFATNMITYLILVFFIQNQAYFENDAKRKN